MQLYLVLVLKIVQYLVLKIVQLPMIANKNIKASCFNQTSAEFMGVRLYMGNDLSENETEKSFLSSQRGEDFSSKNKHSR